LWIYSSSNVFVYQLHEYQKVEPVSDNGPGSFYGTRRDNLANSMKSSLSSKQFSKIYPPYKSLILDTDRRCKGRQNTTLAGKEPLWLRGICSNMMFWHNISTQSERALDPVLRFTILQLQDTIMTKCYEIVLQASLVILIWLG
jgi:hypothetical protein